MDLYVSFDNFSTMNANRLHRYRQETEASQGADRSDVAKPRPPQSRILYLRGIPMSLSEEELTSYCETFGKITKVLILRDKRHGFVEFEVITVRVPATPAGSTSRSDATTRKGPLNWGLGLHPAGANGNIAYIAMSGSVCMRAHAVDYARVLCWAQLGHFYRLPVLLFTVSNIVYPVDITMISQIMSRYGRDSMRRVIVFHRGAVMHALVETKNQEIADRVKTELDGQNIFTQCNTLRVHYSSFRQLHVKYNNERSWDFTNGALSDSDMPVVFVTTHTDASLSCNDLAALFAVYADVHTVKVVQEPRPCAIVHLSNFEQCRTAVRFLSGLEVHGHLLELDINRREKSMPSSVATALETLRRGIDDSTLGGAEAPVLTQDYSTQGYLYARRGQNANSFLCPPNCILHLSNLPFVATDKDVRRFITGLGFEPPVKTEFVTDRQGRSIGVALVTFECLQDAVEVLCLAHGRIIGDPPRRVRIGFGDEHERFQRLADKLYGSEYCLQKGDDMDSVGSNPRHDTIHNPAPALAASPHARPPVDRSEQDSGVDGAHFRSSTLY
ncbi:hypothetical protein FOZ61_006002 [Perkinsus olseni]|uniref:RRM domain-containing protein n=1 Tax=Perkinsus olseni TaxID=32597 RepID=A0A7J6LF52_PEROL|nr:hypothetical protein FOZ61_006002 [Perkinsus olseni]